MVAKNIVLLFQKIDFISANCADPDEMLHYVEFHLGLNCLTNYPFRDFPGFKGFKCCDDGRTLV